jgi:hypothetical protein
MPRPAALSHLWICAALALAGCVEETGGGGFSTASGGSSSRGTSSSRGSASQGEEGPLTRHDVALRFLTAYIRLDRNMALRYATPQAVSKLDWNRPHLGNVPYYDDKMILRFNGGWARVYFQDIGGTFKIVDFDVRRN